MPKKLFKFSLIITTGKANYMFIYQTGFEMRLIKKSI